MSELWTDWLTYRPSDFLMFSPRIYWRLFESINRAFWSAQALVSLLSVMWLLWRRQARLGLVAIGVLWFVVAWEFQLERLAPIHWVASAYAVAFALQGLWLVAAGGLRGLRQAVGWRWRIGGGLFAWALLAHPLVAGLSGRPWTQAELLGLAPDPTAIATLGVLLLAEPASRDTRALWWWQGAFVLPLAWCVISAATLATMGSWQALVPLVAAVLAWRAARR